MAGRATRTARNVGADDIDDSTLRKRARREGNSAQHEALRPERVWTGSMCLARARRRRDPRPRIRFRPLLHLPAAARPLPNRTAHRTRIRAAGMRRSLRLQGNFTLSGDRGICWISPLSHGERGSTFRQRVLPLLRLRVPILAALMPIVDDVRAPFLEGRDMRHARRPAQRILAQR